MKLVEIPVRTLEDELNLMRGTVPANDIEGAFLIGAIRALEWVELRKTSPLEFLQAPIPAHIRVPQ